jgi:predicted HTH domain antitoxin
MEITTPAQVIAELNRIQTEAAKGVAVLFAAESKAVTLANTAEKAEAQAFLMAEGTVADRQALAKFNAADARLEAELAKAELNRVKTKLKQLSDAQVAVSVISRLVELEWRSK